MSSSMQTLPHQAILDRVVVHAAEQASLALSKWFGRNVRIHTHGFASCALGDAGAALGDGETAVVAVHTGMDGALSGHILIALPEIVACQLATILTGVDYDEPSALDDLAQSALTETGNILSSTFLNGLSTALGVKAQPTAPMLLHDMGAAIIEPLIAEQAEHAQRILHLQAVFEIDNVSLSWWLYVVPSAESIQVMLALLH